MKVDAMQAIEVMQDLGYDKGTIDLNLKQRWYDEDGLITDAEWRSYCRLRAAISLGAYRHIRSTNPVVAARLYNNYKGWKSETN